MRGRRKLPSVAGTPGTMNTKIIRIPWAENARL
jgi:hypothetical protein